MSQNTERHKQHAHELHCHIKFLLITLFTVPELTRWIHEIKVDKIVDAEFLQLQNDGAEVGPKYLWVCIVLHLLLVCLLCVQSKALARACTTGSAGSLLRTCLADGSHQQRLHTNTRIIHLRR